MNTPRTRKPRRWTGERPKRTNPENGGTWGITNPEVGAAFAYLVSYWWYVEDKMVLLLDELITGVHRTSWGVDLSARQIFRSIVSQEARITLLRNLLETNPLNKEKPASYDELIDEFDSLNKLRNLYVHGIWFTDAKTRCVTLTRSTAQHEVYTRSQEVTAKELNEVVARMQALHTKIAHRGRLPWP
jgi:hypothetical protein